MIIRDGNRFKLYPHKVRYRYDDDIREDYALPSKEYWEEFAEMWDHVEILEFIDLELSAAQIKRFESIPPGIPEGPLDYLYDYICDGVFPEGLHHPLRENQLEEENLKLKKNMSVVMLELAMLKIKK